MVQGAGISCESLFRKGLSTQMSQQGMSHGKVNIQVSVGVLHGNIAV